MGRNQIVRYHALTLLMLLLIAASSVHVLAQSSDSELAKKTQNPISDLISVPIQTNISFGVGPENDPMYVMNIQPVFPAQIGENWNLINRTIVPLIDQPDLAPGVGDATGMGDIQYQGFFSPKNSEGLVWGVGPVLSFPSATDDLLGSEKWSAGPGVILLKIEGPWVYGALVNNIWSYAGSDSRADVNAGLIQYFVNYNFEGGLYLSSAPINTVNWEADSGNRWTVPLGGGVGKIFRIGNQPLNVQVQAFYNVEHPDDGPEWSGRFQFQFLFPK